MQGRVSCIDEARQPVVCGLEPSHFVFRTEDQRAFYFLERDPSRMIFRDPRVRQRRLEIRAWQRSADELEIIKVYSIRDGKRWNLYYYCPVCNITAYVGGLCWCCQQEFEFHEDPLPN